MKKPHGYNVLSDEVCDAKGCATRIKANVAERINRRPLKCYRHWRDARAKGTWSR